MRTDTERLDWLEAQGNGIALLNDDEGAWIVAGSGFQNIRSTQPPNEMFCTQYMIDAQDAQLFRPTAREAIDAAMDAGLGSKE